MVSGTRRPDQPKKWSESRVAAPKGRCHVGHMGESLCVLRGHIRGFWSNFPWYSVGVLHFFYFLSIFYVNQWEFKIFLVILPCNLVGISHFFIFSVNFPCIFFLFCKFAMLFNGKFVFCQFSMLLPWSKVFIHPGKKFVYWFFCTHTLLEFFLK